MHGGKSTTVYRSGTPATALIVSLAKAVRLILEHLDSNYDYIKSLNKEVQSFLSNYPKVYINSNEYSIPHILNVSILGVKPETMLHALERFDIYISTQTACATGASSKSVYALTKDEKRATSSIRISFSHLNTLDDIKYFNDCFDKCYKELVCKE